MDLIVDKKKCLGEGGFGQVYQGEWKGQRVAIKRFKILDSESDGKTKKMIRHEIDLVKMLKSRYIIQTFDVLEYEGAMVIVSDFAEMGSLRNVLGNESIILTWETKWDFAEGIARGINFLHKSNVIHRDLKSHNILVTKNMEVKLADFGLAKIKKSAKENKTEFSTKLKAEGTIPWMAPELFHKEPIFSRKSDIYAYGMILWEIASQKYPYQGYLSGVIGVLVLVKNLREIIPTKTPKYFAKLISKCWHEIPAERPEADCIVHQIDGLTIDMKLEVDNNIINAQDVTQYIMPIYSDDIYYVDIKDWLDPISIYDGHTTI